MHFISGLPRSGSSLLAAVLRQNPRVTAGVTSPVAFLVSQMVTAMSGAGEFGAVFDTASREAVLRGAIAGWYRDSPAGGVVFDTNRSWTGRMALLQALYPGARMVVCVREVGWILDSVERLLRRNPTQPSKLLNFCIGGSVYERAELLMNPEQGLVGQAWSTLREAWFGEHADKLIVVGYDAFVADPAEAMRRLYEALGEPPFAHDFSRVAMASPEYDASLSTPGLHDVRAAVAIGRRETCLPPDLFRKYAGTEFWSNGSLAGRAHRVC